MKYLKSYDILDKINEVNRFNQNYDLFYKNSVNEWFHNTVVEDEEYSLSNYFNKSYSLLEANDTTEFVPRFTLKKYTNPLFQQFPPNKELKYDRDLMIKAMEYGMIIMIQYRGADDNFYMGRSRVIYPMCLGTSSKGRPLLRAYHIKGWSYSQNKNTEKVWRMFRTDRIMSMSFSGSFFRLTPEGYNALDRGMRGGIIKSVNIDEVRNNQKKLADSGSIQAKKEVVLDEKQGRIVVVETINSETILDLTNPFENKNIDKNNLKLIRMTFLKSTNDNNKGLCILGAYGQKGNTVKISSSGKYLGTYKVIKATFGDALGKPHLRAIDGISKFDLHMFVKKRD